MNNFNNANNLNEAEDQNLERAFQSRFDNFEVTDVAESNWATIATTLPRPAAWWERYRHLTPLLLLLLLIPTCYFGQKQVGNKIAFTVVADKLNDNGGTTTIETAETTERTETLPDTTFTNARRLKNKSPYGLQHFEATEASPLILGLINQAPKRDNVTKSLRPHHGKNLIFSENNILAENNILPTENIIVPIIAANETDNIVNARIEPLDKIASIEARNLAIPIDAPMIQLTKLFDMPIASIIPKTPKTLQNWVWSVAAMPQYTYFAYTPNLSDHVILNHFESDAAFSAKRMGFQAQVGMERNLSKGFHLEMGLAYQRLAKNIYYEHHQVRMDTVVSTVSAREIILTPVLQTHRQNETATYDLLGARVGMSYHRPLGRGAWAAVAQTNISMNVLTNDWSQQTANVAFSLGLERSIGRGLQLRVSPTIQYFLDNKTFSNETLSAQPYTIGLNIGVLFR